jgi:hypothetical protein
VTKLRTGRSGLPFPVGPRDFSLSQNVQTGSVTDAVSDSVGKVFFSSEVNWPGRLANQTTASKAEVMNDWSLFYHLCALLLSFFNSCRGSIERRQSSLRPLTIEVTPRQDNDH